MRQQICQILRLHPSCAAAYPTELAQYMGLGIIWRQPEGKASEKNKLPVVEDCFQILWFILHTRQLVYAVPCKTKRNET